MRVVCPLRFLQVKRLLTCIMEFREIFPVCQPNADLLELQALQQRGGGTDSADGFDLELDIHRAMVCPPPHLCVCALAARARVARV